MASALLIQNHHMQDGNAPMDMSELHNALTMAEARQHVWISTADSLGVPHIASVGSFRVEKDSMIVLGDWYCPVTLMNLKGNDSITLVVWDVNTDQGYQILGRVADIAAMKSDQENALAQSAVGDRELWIRPQTVYAFSHAPHDDVEAMSLESTSPGIQRAVNSAP